jgi:nitroimidazol reductase NimA-like FMN-containing flavoprotein (pyridoxamine 5'-phosphate oxidase superfamily)
MMVIREMSRDECLALLARSSVLRLACARDDQPYVVPVSLAFDEPSGCLYGHTTLGRKIEWMRSNPRVCVEADEITAPDRWMSVVADGRYEEVPAAPPPPPPGQTPLGGEADFRKAFEALAKLPAWWKPGGAAWAARARSGATEPFASIFYRIRLDAITGRAAEPDTWAGIPSAEPHRRG